MQFGYLYRPIINYILIHVYEIVHQDADLFLNKSWSNQSESQYAAILTNNHSILVNLDAFEFVFDAPPVMSVNYRKYLAVVEVQEDIAQLGQQFCCIFCVIL